MRSSPPSLHCSLFVQASLCVNIYYALTNSRVQERLVRSLPNLHSYGVTISTRAVAYLTVPHTPPFFHRTYCYNFIEPLCPPIPRLAINTQQHNISHCQLQAENVKHTSTVAARNLKNESALLHVAENHLKIRLPLPKTVWTDGDKQGVAIGVRPVDIFSAELNRRREW